MADGDYVNRNVCKNGTVSVPSSKLAAAAVLADIKCSEVVVRCTAATKFWDGTADFEVPADTIMTFRGLTNANQLSAHNSGGTGTVYFRAQYFSSNVLSQG